MYVLLRRWTAPSSTHFYIFCLVSFIFYSFHYTGKLNAFDWSIYWCNVVAWMLQPALFLHFVLTFPERRQFVTKHRLGGAAAVCARAGAAGDPRVHAALRASQRTAALESGPAGDGLTWRCTSWLRRRCCWYSYLRASTPILRQQLKWVTRGTIVAIAPFTLFYIVPYLFGALPTDGDEGVGAVAGLAAAHFRIRDFPLSPDGRGPDLQARHGVHAGRGGVVVMAYFALVAGVAELVHTRIPSTGPYGLILAMVVTALLFDPVRKWIQDGIDQFFYRTRYDYRKTLIEFGRELSAETDLDEMLSFGGGPPVAHADGRSAGDFSGDRRGSDHFVIAKSFGMSQTSGLDLSFLSAQRPEMEAGHLFFDNTHQVPRENPAAQTSIAKLDLNYYIPCRVQRKPIAVLGWANRWKAIS